MQKIIDFDKNCLFAQMLTLTIKNYTVLMICPLAMKLEIHLISILITTNQHIILPTFL